MFTMESGETVKSMVLEDTRLQIVTSMKVNLWTVIGLARANTLGLMVVTTRGSGSVTR